MQKEKCEWEMKLLEAENNMLRARLDWLKACGQVGSARERYEQAWDRCERIRRSSEGKGYR